MCAGRGEGPSLLGVLECLFPLGHCSLNTGCRNMVHSSNSTAWLGEEQEKDFPGRNLLSNERLYLRCGGRGRNWRAWCGGVVYVLGRVQLVFSSLVVMAGNVGRLCPVPHHPWKGQARAGSSCTLAWLRAAAQLYVLYLLKVWMYCSFLRYSLVQHINGSVPVQGPSLMLWLMRCTGFYSHSRSKFSQ